MKKKQNPEITKFGKRARELRKSQKLSQQESGLKAGLHYTYIGAVERGEKNLSLQSIQKIANGLKVKIAELFPSQELSSEEKVIEKIVVLLRRKELHILHLALRVVKAIVQDNTSKGES